MRLALQLAQRGAGQVNPNPMVGAVIVKEGRVIGQGWHEKFGGLHAERNALAQCKESPEHATLYVTLEPCCHHGKTPPCTDAILQAGISKVVIGSSDPNPLVAGKGVEILREHGISVIEGVEKQACDQLNAPFFHFIQHKTPYGILKYAMTLDGKIATHTGASQWITGEAAREQVHRDRNRYAAIMVGVGTVCTDNPLLTCRLQGGRNPIRIICDSKLRTPLTARVVQTAQEIPTILATCVEQGTHTQPYQAAGCEVLTIPAKNGHVDLQILMQQLGQRGIDSVLVEGGATLNWSALQAGVIHRVQAYIAPKLFGGEQAKSPIGGLGVNHPNQAFRLTEPHITAFGDDFLFESEVISCSPES